MGLTLVEIIVAMAILGIIAVSMLTIFTGSYSSIFSTGRKTKAINESAQTYLDQIINGEIDETDFDDLPSNISIATPIETDVNSGLKKVKVTVTYQDGKSYTLFSLMP